MRWLGRWLHWALSPMIALVSSRTRPRVRVEVRTVDGDVLLVRGWFSSQKWGLPGGGVDKGEAPTHAAVRELREETGIRIHKQQLEYVTTCEAAWPLRCDIVVYTVTLPDTVELQPLPWIRRLEIIDRTWQPANQLPDNTSPLCEAIIDRTVPEKS